MNAPRKNSLKKTTEHNGKRKTEKQNKNKNTEASDNNKIEMQATGTKKKEKRTRKTNHPDKFTNHSTKESDLKENIESKRLSAKTEITNLIQKGRKINKEKVEEIRELIKKSSSQQAANSVEGATTVQTEEQWED